MEKYSDWEWYSKEIQAEEHSITLTFAEWVGIHGALLIALRDAQMAEHPSEIATEMIERIEELFGKAGMTQTELDQLYWAESACNRTCYSAGAAPAQCDTDETSELWSDGGTP